jgi:hypothetical protein
MKLILKLSFVFILFASLSFGQKKENKIPDTYLFKETLLQSLVENDESLFLTLAPAQNDIDTALKYHNEPQDLTSKGADSLFSLLQEKAGDNFKTLQKFGTTNNIDWSMITEDSLVALPKSKFENRFPVLRFTYYFSHLNEHYYFSTTRLLLINNHWVLTNGVRLKKVITTSEE